MNSISTTGLKTVGHRGAKNLAPENTIASLQKALGYHVDEIEVDLRVTRDGVVILHHDATLRLPSGATITIGKTSYQELLHYKPDLATLEQAIRTIGGKVPLQLEVKGGEPTGPVVIILTMFLKLGWKPHDFLFGSKKQTTLMELHTALPAIPTVIIEPYLSIRAHFRARQLSTNRISMNQRGLWSGFIRSMHRRGYQLYAYPLNDTAKAKTWHGHGLSGVITDRPDLFS